MPGGDCYAVLRDQEARNGADAVGTGALSVDIDTGQHIGQRIDIVLPPDHQVHCPPVAEDQATRTQKIPGVPQPQEATGTAAETRTESVAFAEFADATEAATVAQEAEEEAEQASASFVP